MSDKSTAYITNEANYNKEKLRVSYYCSAKAGSVMCYTNRHFAYVLTYFSGICRWCVSPATCHCDNINIVTLQTLTLTKPYRNANPKANPNLKTYDTIIFWRKTLWHLKCRNLLKWQLSIYGKPRPGGPPFCAACFVQFIVAAKMHTFKITR